MKEIPLSKGYVALVDDADYERVMAAGPWYATVGKTGVYAKRLQRFGSRRKSLFLHRFICNVNNPNIQIDHRDHNGLNNQRFNLRLCTRRRNNRNQRPRRMAKTPSSSYKGVNRSGQKGWRARVKREGQWFECGSFTSEIDAALAYDRKAEELFGEFAWLNRSYFPEVMAAHRGQSTESLPNRA